MMPSAVTGFWRVQLIVRRLLVAGETAAGSCNLAFNMAQNLKKNSMYWGKHGSIDRVHAGAARHCKGPPCRDRVSSN